MKNMRLTIVAILYAVAGSVVSLALAGAGHGWLEPMFYFAIPMFILCPLVAKRGADFANSSAIVWPEAALLGAGLLANAVMLWTYLHYHPTATYRGAPLQSALVICWLCLWYSWQVRAAISARRRLELRENDRTVSLWPEFFLLTGGMMGNVIAAISLTTELRYFGFTFWVALALIVSFFWLRWQVRAAAIIRSTLCHSSEKSRI